MYFPSINSHCIRGNNFLKLIWNKNSSTAVGILLPLLKNVLGDLRIHMENFPYTQIVNVKSINDIGSL